VHFVIVTEVEISPQPLGWERRGEIGCSMAFQSAGGLDKPTKSHWMIRYVSPRDAKSSDPNHRLLHD